MGFRTWRFLLWLPLFLCWVALGRAEDAGAQKHMLWEATAGKSIVYLLGTIHVGTADLYPLPAVIENAFKQSNILVE